MALTFPRRFPLTPTLLGGAFIGLGLTRLFAPHQAYRLFGLPLLLSQAPKPEPKPSPFLYANAGRDLSLGLAYFIFAWQQNAGAVRGLMLASVVTAEGDAYVVWAFGGLEYGGWNGNWAGHAVGGVMLGIVAWTGWGL